jgi:hypothetical protein
VCSCRDSGRAASQAGASPTKQPSERIAINGLARWLLHNSPAPPPGVAGICRATARCTVSQERTRMPGPWRGGTFEHRVGCAGGAGFETHRHAVFRDHRRRRRRGGRGRGNALPAARHVEEQRFTTALSPELLRRPGSTAPSRGHHRRRPSDGGPDRRRGAGGGWHHAVSCRPTLGRLCQHLPDHPGRAPDRFAMVGTVNF